MPSMLPPQTIVTASAVLILASWVADPCWLLILQSPISTEMARRVSQPESWTLSSWCA